MVVVVVGLVVVVGSLVIVRARRMPWLELKRCLLAADRRQEEEEEEEEEEEPLPPPGALGQAQAQTLGWTRLLR